MHSPPVANGESIIRTETEGDPFFMTGRVVDTSGRPIAGAEIDIWHSSPGGLYENEDESQADMNLRGKFTTDADGIFAFRSILPAGYPIPTTGVVGQLLHAQGRHPFRPAHVHRSEEHTSELQSLMRISYAVFCLKQKKHKN